jgi:hypothetical protein
MWYAAHVVMVFRYRTGEQKRLTVWENVFLVEAESPDEAHKLAVEIGKGYEAQDDPSLTLGDTPVRLTFAGVRKVVSCLEAPTPDALPLATGTELTYSQFTLDSEESLAGFVAGEPVPVVLEE